MNRPKGWDNRKEHEDGIEGYDFSTYRRVPRRGHRFDGEDFVCVIVDGGGYYIEVPLDRDALEKMLRMLDEDAEGSCTTP